MRKCTLCAKQLTKTKCLSRGMNQAVLECCSGVLATKLITGAVHMRVTVLM